MSPVPWARVTIAPPDTRTTVEKLRDSLCPYAGMAYEEQLAKKQETVVQLVKQMGSEIGRAHGGRLKKWVERQCRKNSESWHLVAQTDYIILSPRVMGYRQAELKIAFVSWNNCFCLMFTKNMLFEHVWIPTCCPSCFQFCVVQFRNKCEFSVGYMKKDKQDNTVEMADGDEGDSNKDTTEAGTKEENGHTNKDNVGNGKDVDVDKESHVIDLKTACAQLNQVRCRLVTRIAQSASGTHFKLSTCQYKEYMFTENCTLYSYTVYICTTPKIQGDD